jgi:hypothetical protein
MIPTTDDRLIRPLPNPPADYHWIQVGGHDSCAYMCGYLSGNHGGKGWGLITLNLPALFRAHGLEEAILPADKTGVLFKALRECRQVLTHHRMIIEPIPAEENPLYTSSVASIGEASARHLHRHCLAGWPFVRITQVAGARRCEVEACNDPAMWALRAAAHEEGLHKHNANWA